MIPTSLKRAFVIGGLVAAAGCSHSQPSADLVLAPSASDVPLLAHFDRAIYSKSFDGQMDVILLGSNTRTGEVNDPSLVADSNVSQYVHIKVLYRPKNEARGGAFATTNSRIDWIVSGGQQTRITYGGAGWARVDFSDDTADITLRDTTITRQQIVGNMADPIGTAKLDGEFTATRDDATVKSYLQQLAELKTDTNLSQAATNTPTAP